MTDTEYTIVIFLSACLGGLIGYVFRFLQEEESKGTGIVTGQDSRTLEEQLKENEAIAGIRSPSEYD